MERPFLKWPGGKFRLIPKITALLPHSKRLVEPFVGGGAVFLNTSYERYLLSDTNPDLISVYQTLKTNPEIFIHACERLFIPKNNCAKRYYEFRLNFNSTQDSFLRAVLFVYLNRHGYNGLCRYNRKGGFNVPFGSYVKPYFPKAEMIHFAKRAQYAEFHCLDFKETFTHITKNDVIYCDPPYVPLSETAFFTQYGQFGFDLNAQKQLVECALRVKKKGCTVLISNHATELTRDLYRDAEIVEFLVRRSISCKGNNRGLAQELIAVF